MTLMISTIAALALLLVTIHSIDAIDKLREAIIMSNTEAINAIAAVITQLDKSRTEIVGCIQGLQDQIAAGVPAEQLDLSALQAAAQALDDVVPDVAVSDG